jgi:nucleoside transporter
MNWLQFAVWGAYLTSMGGYLSRIGLGENIGWFYSVQGIVSIFMPALMGVVADRWIPAQRLMGICHLVSALLMSYVGYQGLILGDAVTFVDIFPVYTLAVAFYMPTLALSNSVSYTSLDKAGLDTVKNFPPIRIFGTIGFIVSMWIVDFMGIQHTSSQFFASAAWGIMLGVYAFSLPQCAVNKTASTSLSDIFNLKSFALFKESRMRMFFIFSMLLGVSLQITNGYANPYISAFSLDSSYSEAFFSEHANLLISLSQISETLCILLIPVALRRFGIKSVMLMAMMAWVFRFGLFAVGDPMFPGVICFILSMIVYGIAFDFFNISGSLFVDKETDPSARSSAQGLFMLMTNGLGATLGTLAAQYVVNMYVYSESEPSLIIEGWRTSWSIFAAYASCVCVLFALLFKSRQAK